MSLFSLNWFKSEKQKEMDSLKMEEQKLKNALLQQQLDEEYLPVSQTKNYSSLRLINDVLTVVLLDGTQITKMGCDLNMLTKVKSAKDETEILEVLRDETIGQRMNNAGEIENELNLDDIKTGIDHLVQLGELELRDGAVYFSGIKRSIPKLLVNELAKIALNYDEGDDDLLDDESYLALKRFFMWSCLNPRAEVVDQLYEFLVNNSFRITRQGFFVALRNVVSLPVESEQQPGLVDFVSNAYNKIRAVWKKKPDNYRVEKVGDEYKFKLTTSIPEGEVVGNLDTLYKDLPEMSENRYTDAHTRTFDIRIGRVVSMDPKECKWSLADCAEAGLHFTSDQIHYVGCGDTSVLILINPMKVVGIGTHKGRCYEYLPIMSVPRDEATKILHDLDFDTLELDDDYAIHELDNLEEKVKEGFAAEAVKYDFNIPSLSTKDMSDIINQLDDIRHEVRKRVVKIN